MYKWTVVYSTLWILLPADIDNLEAKYISVLFPISTLFLDIQLHIALLDNLAIQNDYSDANNFKETKQDTICLDVLMQKRQTARKYFSSTSVNILFQIIII